MVFIARIYDEKKEELADFAARVRRQREHLHLTQEEAAARLDMSVNFYGKVERGIHGLSYSSLIKMKREFHVSVDYLLTGETPDEMDSPILHVLNTAPEEKRVYLEELILIATQLYQEG